MDEVRSYGPYVRGLECATITCSMVYYILLVNTYKARWADGDWDSRLKLNLIVIGK